jgi:hypothetical protein
LDDSASHRQICEREAARFKIILFIDCTIKTLRGSRDFLMKTACAELNLRVVSGEVYQHHDLRRKDSFRPRTRIY